MQNIIVIVITERRIIEQITCIRDDDNTDKDRYSQVLCMMMNGGSHSRSTVGTVFNADICMYIYTARFFCGSFQLLQAVHEYLSRRTGTSHNFRNSYKAAQHSE
jgi:hypothetical protein